MGTLGNQPERNGYCISNQTLDSFLQDAAELAGKNKISIEAVINGV